MATPTSAEAVDALIIQVKADYENKIMEAKKEVFKECEREIEKLQKNISKLTFSTAAQKTRKRRKRQVVPPNYEKGPFLNFLLMAENLKTMMTGNSN